ncbi:MAG: Gfo/Idh/MocA family oxidoreductase [Nocardioidaceae bacterium]
MDRVRWGIIATGKIARTFAADLAITPGAVLAAVGSRRIESARAFADEFGSRDGDTRAYGSYDEVAADPDVDVIYVATPHAFHVDHVQLCFAHAKAVLCEKPVTLNAADAEILVQEARRRGHFFMEAMWMRCNPAIRAAVDLVASGAIGSVTHVSADFGFVPNQPPGHRLFDPALGASALLDIGIYPLTFASLFLGTPASLTSVGTLSDRGIDLSCASLLTYGDGATAVLTCTMLADTPSRAAVSGTLGHVEFSRRFHCPTGYTVTTAAGETSYEHQTLGNGYVDEIEEVQRCLRAGLPESPLVPLDDTLSLMRQLDQIRKQIGTRLPGDEN